MDRFTWGIVAAALLLVAAAVGSVALLQGRAVPPDLSRPDGVVRAYVEALDTGRPERAWDLLAASVRQNVTRDEFVRRATSFGGRRQERITIEAVHVDGAVARVELGYTYVGGGGLFGSGASTYRRTVRLEQEAGAWRITVPPDPHLIEPRR